MKEGEKVYLGDSVYADFDGWGITLTTDNGFGPSNTIVLEDWVYVALVRFASTPEGEKFFKLPEVKL